MSRATGRQPKEIVCEQCPRTFTSTRNMLRHVREAHTLERKRLNCGRCDAQYGRRSDLRAHYRRRHPSHTKEVEDISTDSGQHTGMDELDVHASDTEPRSPKRQRTASSSQLCEDTPSQPNPPRKSPIGNVVDRPVRPSTKSPRPPPTPTLLGYVSPPRVQRVLCGTTSQKRLLTSPRNFMSGIERRVKEIKEEGTIEEYNTEGRIARRNTYKRTYVLNS